LNRLFYFKGKQALIDILSYKLFTSKKIDKKLLKLIDEYKTKDAPILPVNAKVLMEEYNIPEGKNLGSKLKIIEEAWVNNNFNITEKQINKIVDY
jgi:poly(A) polymerase